MVYHKTHNLLLVGSCPYTPESGGTAGTQDSGGADTPCDISGWRLLDVPPFWGPKLGQQIGKVKLAG